MGEKLRNLDFIVQYAVCIQKYAAGSILAGRVNERLCGARLPAGLNHNTLGGPY